MTGFSSYSWVLERIARTHLRLFRVAHSSDYETFAMVELNQLSTYDAVEFNPPRFTNVIIADLDHPIGDEDILAWERTRLLPNL